ncbi:MAG TPA: adenylate/guanylate cyclase domain-containing protein [Gemmataceae bacterium]|nr:adenylate/guanylate cyclase domain-containing protein [Gemmataceae bacterium]
MSASYQMQVYENRQLVHCVEFEGTIELGRQGEGDQELFSERREADRRRVVVAHQAEPNVSRKHLLIQPLAENRVRVTNLSKARCLALPNGEELRYEASQELPVPVVLNLGKRTLILQPQVPGGQLLQSLPEVVPPPGSAALTASALASLDRSNKGQIGSRAILSWLRTVVEVLQSAVHSSDFFQRAAQAVVQLAGLDSGRVLLLHEGKWQTQTCWTANPSSTDADTQPSQHVLNRVHEEKRTFWALPATSTLSGASLIGVKAVVASPILQRDGTVIGVLYGERRRDIRSATETPIAELEAMLVELLAGGVAAGLARLEQEKAALAARFQFEQFFTPELSRQLEARPDLLEGRDTEVTLLFCDIRGFSRVSERLGPVGTVQWLRAVMGALSDCVRAHAGVLVDYIGDELFAMWGAPEVQPAHAQLACRAALDMLSVLPELNRQWQQALGEPMDLGIGINTGIAQVGNTGTRHKFKYGPLGNTVNLASRVQGATKHFMTKLLITGATQAALGEGFEARRLCRVRVVNIHEPVELYELPTPNHPCWADAKREYEAGLAEFENQNFHQAARILANLRGKCPDDGPALLLLSRVVNCMVKPHAPADLVWELSEK